MGGDPFAACKPDLLGKLERAYLSCNANHLLPLSGWCVMHRSHFSDYYNLGKRGELGVVSDDFGFGGMRYRGIPVVCDPYMDLKDSPRFEARVRGK